MDLSSFGNLANDISAEIPYEVCLGLVQMQIFIKYEASMINHGLKFEGYAGEVDAGK